MRRGGAPKGKGSVAAGRKECAWRVRKEGGGGSAHISKKSGRKDVHRILISISRV